jgi:hypothetical protein
LTAPWALVFKGYNLPLDEFWGKDGYNDVLVLSRPDVAKEIHAAYLDAGTGLFAPLHPDETIGVKPTTGSCWTRSRAPRRSSCIIPARSVSSPNHSVLIETKGRDFAAIGRDVEFSVHDDGFAINRAPDKLLPQLSSSTGVECHNVGVYRFL